MAANKTKGVFHLRNAQDFHSCIDIALKRYIQSTEKHIENTMFLIMGFNHLREWIAPGYRHTKKPTNKAEKFYNTIYENKEFKIINKLCNKSKYLTCDIPTSYETNPNVSEWEDVELVLNICEGPPSFFFVDGKEISEILSNVNKLYLRWFEKNKSNN